MEYITQVNSGWAGYVKNDKGFKKIELAYVSCDLKPLLGEESFCESINRMLSYRHQNKKTSRWVDIFPAETGPNQLLDEVIWLRPFHSFSLKGRRAIIWGFSAKAVLTQRSRPNEGLLSNSYQKWILRSQELPSGIYFSSVFPHLSAMNCYPSTFPAQTGLIFDP